MGSRVLVRSQVRAAICDHLAELLGPDVTVTRSFPGQFTQYENVWCNGITGQIEQPFIMTGRHARYDVFSLTFMFSAAMPGCDEDQNSERAQEMFEALETLIAENADGQLFSDANCETTLSDLDGPNIWETGQGDRAILEATVECRSYLT